MKKTGLIFIVMALTLLLLSACDEGIFGSLEKLEQQAIEENNPSAGVINYTVTFDMNEGAGMPPDSQTVQAGTEITLPTGSGFTRSGFAFDGWYIAGDTVNTYPAESKYTVNGNVTFYAIWSARFTVTFDINEGSGTAPVPQTAVPNSEITLPPGTGLSKTGYTFDGWSEYADASAGNYSSGEKYTVTMSIKLFTIWKPITYTVKYDENNGTGTAMPDSTFTYGTSNTLAANTYTRDGYGFSGWALSSGATSVEYTNGQTLIPTQNLRETPGEITLYAVWSAGQFTVTYNSNGATQDPPLPDTVSYDTVIKLPVQGTLSRTGYTFGGWNTNAQGTGTNYAAGADYQVKESIPLYAKWFPIQYTVAYNGNGIGVSGTMGTSTFTYGTDNTLSYNTFTRTGYTFLGWNINSGATTAEYTNEQTLNGSQNLLDNPGTVTLYAIWQGNNYSIVFNKVNASATGTMNNQAMTYGQSQNLTANTFSLRGYQFKGWSTTSGGTTIAYADKASVNNLASSGTFNLYAVWEKVSGIISSEVAGANTVAEKFTWLRNNALSSTDYIIEAAGDESLSYQDLTFSGQSLTGVTIRLRGLTSTRTITLSGIGSMFRVGAGIHLYLGDLITLVGSSTNNNSLVYIAGGTVTMGAGATITGNTFTVNSYSYGGGVRVDGGAFNMTGGTITLNDASRGAGVYLTSGTFTMNNSAATISSNTSTSVGGGVCISGGTFDMSAGTISGNHGTDGGGVYLSGGTFNLSNTGKITYNNTTSTTGDGGGVSNHGTFNMGGGSIDNNTANRNGGGVYTQGAVNLTGGDIYNNKTTRGEGMGGGVCVSASGNLVMNGGTIYSNTAEYGGGVAVDRNGTSSLFTKGYFGVIRDNVTATSGGTILPNHGREAYVLRQIYPSLVASYRERNAMENNDDKLDASVTGPAGGWDN